MMDRAGQQLGHYHLVRLLGEGGFAQVYLGEHVDLGTQAAIKILLERLGSPQEVEKFRDEARTIAHLRHPNIVEVLDFGVDGTTPYLVMKYAPNGSLRQRHPGKTRLPLATILPYVRQVADALQCAHNQKLIHRDIKPENMLLGYNNEVLLSDFGIAIISQSSRYQGAQDMAGTVAYMAPEQIQARPRPASDQYSLGIVAYEWLCGTRPFEGTFTEIAVKHTTVPPSPLSSFIAIAPAAEQAIMRALAKDPAQRFPTVQEFATALEQAAQGKQYGGLAPTVYAPPPGSSGAPDQASFSSPKPIRTSYSPPPPNVNTPVIRTPQPQPGSIGPNTNPPPPVVNSYGQYGYPPQPIVNQYGQYAYPPQPAVNQYGQYVYPPQPGANPYGHYGYPPQPVVNQYGQYVYPTQQAGYPYAGYYAPPGYARPQVKPSYLPLLRGKARLRDILWVGGYAALLVMLFLPYLLAVSGPYSADTSLVVLAVAALVLTPMGFLLAGAILGKWRGVLAVAPVPITYMSILYLRQPFFFRFYETWLILTGFLLAPVLLIGLIYERRRTRHAMITWLTMLMGLMIFGVGVSFVALLANPPANLDNSATNGIVEGIFFWILFSMVFALIAGFFVWVIQKIAGAVQKKNGQAAQRV